MVHVSGPIKAEFDRSHVAKGVLSDAYHRSGALRCFTHAYIRASFGVEFSTKHVKRSGDCSGTEVLASYYSSGRRTASGESFDANGNTAAARTWALAYRNESGDW